MYRCGRDRYGAATIDRCRGPAEIMQLYRYGMTDLHRCLRPGGIMFVKCQDGIAGGRQHRYTEGVRRWAVEGLRMQDIDKLHMFHSGWRGVVVDQAETCTEGAERDVGVQEMTSGGNAGLWLQPTFNTQRSSGRRQTNWVNLSIHQSSPRQN